MYPCKNDKSHEKKALIGVTAALSCLLVYVLACAMSPVTWSPDSSKIAILVTPAGDDFEVSAIFTYDIKTGERVLLDKVMADGVLSAPSWSPDGKWIAYFKVEPSPAQEPSIAACGDPNAKVPTYKPADSIRIDKTPEQAEQKEVVQAFFSEDNKMLPHFLFDVLEEELTDGEQKGKTMNAKLIIVSPCGKQMRVVSTMLVKDDSDIRKLLMTIQTEWSKDSNRLFYARVPDEDLYYFSSLDIDSGEACAHLYGSTGGFSLSPDGEWIASLLKDDSQTLLTVAGVDGTSQKYFALELEDNEALKPWSSISWSPDSTKVLIPAEHELAIVDTHAGTTQKYLYPENQMVGAARFSPDGRKVYYLFGREVGDPNLRKGELSVNSIDLNNRKVRTIVALPNFKEIGQFSVSPNGRMFLVRGTTQDGSTDEQTVLVLWNGKTQQIIKTDDWLYRSVYSDDDLAFDERLIGQWRGKDGEVLAIERGKDKRYRITATDKDEQQDYFAADLVKLNDTVLLAMFRDDSMLHGKQPQSSRTTLPANVFALIQQIEPTLQIRWMDLKGAYELLEQDPNQPEDKRDTSGKIWEGIRVQRKDSSGPGEKKQR